MTDLTKLADAVRNTADAIYMPDSERRAELLEVERILRSAAGVDVAALSKRVRRARILACGAWSDVTEGGNVNAKKCSEAQKMEDELCASIAALESALRLALAAREGFVMVPVEPTPDMLEAGAGTKYEKRARNVWRDMIAAAAPKGTT